MTNFKKCDYIGIFLIYKFIIIHKLLSLIDCEGIHPHEPFSNFALTNILFLFGGQLGSLPGINSKGWLRTLAPLLATRLNFGEKLLFMKTVFTTLTLLLKHQYFKFTHRKDQSMIAFFSSIIMTLFIQAL